jgi:hypothetical protein
VDHSAICLSDASSNVMGDADELDLDAARAAYTASMYDYPRIAKDPPPESMFNLAHPPSLVLEVHAAGGEGQIARRLQDQRCPPGKNIYGLHCHQSLRKDVTNPRLGVDTRIGNTHMETLHQDDLLRFKTEHERFYVPRKKTKAKRRPKPAGKTPILKNSADTTSGKWQQLLADATSTDVTGVAARASSADDATSAAATSTDATDAAAGTGTSNDAASTSSSSSACVAALTGYWGNPYWVDRRKGKRLRELDAEALEELVDALPLCDGKRVIDLDDGTGGSALAILEAYPTVQIELMDKSSEFPTLARM